MAISISNKQIISGTKAAASTSPLETGLKGKIFRAFGSRITPKEVMFFTSQLSLMLEIGTPLTSSLKALTSQTKNPTFKAILRAMLRDIEEGRQLSDAMKRHPQIFNNIFISMVNAGETGGFLKKILDSIVVIQEKRQALITQLRATLTYPGVLCLVAIGVVVFVLVGILPKFSVLFEGKESILPLTTKFLMALSSSMKGYWWVYVISSMAFLVGIKFWMKSEPGRAFIDRVSMSAPMVAGLSNKIYTCQLLRSLGYLMDSHINLLEALRVTRTTFSNRYFQTFIDQIITGVQQGERFSQPFARSPFILESVKQMVATGEEVGNIPKVLLRLSEFYDAEVDRSLKIIASMIEPLALVVLGAVVGIIVSSVILPVFKIASVIH